MVSSKSQDITHLQTPLDRLKVLNNDYSEQEKVFQSGRPLVDTDDEIVLATLQSDEAVKIRKQRLSMRRRFLDHDASSTSVSLVIPVRGRRKVLIECLESIKRQTFVQLRPSQVEILLIVDGPASISNDEPMSPELTRTINSFPPQIGWHLFQLTMNCGPSTARNVGVEAASNRIVVFVDSSMILEENFLVEHMLRHQRCQKVALLGFKQNITWQEYETGKDGIIKGSWIPDYRNDWKWQHVLDEREANFKFNGKMYRAGDLVHYMELTNYLRTVKSTRGVGYRILPTFFQTNIGSVSLEAVKGVGGFDRRFDPLWGFEDSYLGALLSASLFKMVPCPSSLAFKIEHEEDPTKHYDIDENRRLFHEMLAKKKMDDLSSDNLKEKIQFLMGGAILKEIMHRPASRSRSPRNVEIREDRFVTNTLLCGATSVDPSGTFCSHCRKPVIKVDEAVLLLQTETESVFHVDKLGEGFIALANKELDRREFIKWGSLFVPLTAAVIAAGGDLVLRIEDRGEKDLKKVTEWRTIVSAIESVIEGPDKALKLRQMVSDYRQGGYLTASILCEAALEHLCDSEPLRAQHVIRSFFRRKKRGRVYHVKPGVTSLRDWVK